MRDLLPVFYSFPEFKTKNGEDKDKAIDTSVAHRCAKDLGFYAYMNMLLGLGEVSWVSNFILEVVSATSLFHPQWVIYTASSLIM